MIIVTIVCVVTVLGCVLCIVQSPLEETNDPSGSFVFIRKQYSSSNEMLEIDLQYFGNTLKSVTGEDFQWYLNDQHIGPVYLIFFADDNDGRLESGSIIRIGLRTEQIPPGNRIKITFRNSFQIIFIT